MEPTGHASLVDARGLRRTFDDGRVEALRGVDLAIAGGEFTAIQGPSGCGKTTLLQILGGLDAPTAGELLFRGRPLPPPRGLPEFRARTIGFVFQASHLLPTLTSVENVQIPMLEMAWPARQRRERARALLESVGLGDRMHHRPRALSGGERQRVAIARSLANDPSIVLADEPTGNLDSGNADRLLTLLRTLHTERRVTIVIVTHDPDVAREGGRIIQMRDGRIVSESRTPVVAA